MDQSSRTAALDQFRKNEVTAAGRLRRRRAWARYSRRQPHLQLRRPASCRRLCPPHRPHRPRRQERHGHHGRRSGRAEKRYCDREADWAEHSLDGLSPRAPSMMMQSSASTAVRRLHGIAASPRAAHPGSGRRALPRRSRGSTKRAPGARPNRMQRPPRLPSRWRNRPCSRRWSRTPRASTFPPFFCAPSASRRDLQLLL